MFRKNLTILPCARQALSPFEKTVPETFHKFPQSATFSVNFFGENPAEIIDMHRREL